MTHLLDWNEGELAELEASANGLAGFAEAWPPSAHDERLDRADPLSKMTPKQIWHDCVWLSEETAETKLFLLCIGRFMSPDLRSSSMSYSQIMANCSISERFAKYAAKRARDRWLRIEVGKGRRTRNGRQNLYHGIIPPDLLDQLRVQRLKGLSVPTDATVIDLATSLTDRVHGVHPDQPSGVQDRDAPDARVHIMQGRGAPDAPLLTKTHNEERGETALNGVKAKNALGSEAAYAERNIRISNSGRLSIGGEFRKQLNEEGFTDDQIDRALNCTLAAMGTDRNNIKIVAQVRRQCTFRLQDDNKASASATRHPGILRNGRPSL